MNLTADEYFTIIDEMTLLRLQNQRFIEDNSILAHRVQQQNILLFKKQQQSCASNIHLKTSYSQAKQLEASHLGYDILKPFALPFNGQIQKCQSMKTLNQNEVLQKQIQNLRNEINSLKSLKNVKGSQNINPTSKKADKNSKKTPNPNKSKEAKQLFENSKLLYSLEKNCKSEPSIDQISHWICGKELKRIETQINVDQDEFNPIKTVKQAQRQKILQQLTNKTFNLPTKKESMNKKNNSNQSQPMKSQQQLKSEKSIKGKQSIKLGTMNKFNTNQTNNNQNLKIMKKSKSYSKVLTQTGQSNELKREGSTNLAVKM